MQGTVQWQGSSREVWEVDRANRTCVSGPKNTWQHKMNSLHMQPKCSCLGSGFNWFAVRFGMLWGTVSASYSKCESRRFQCCGTVFSGSLYLKQSRSLMLFTWNPFSSCSVAKLFSKMTTSLSTTKYQLLIFFSSLILIIWGISNTGQTSSYLV